MTILLRHSLSANASVPPRDEAFSDEDTDTVTAAYFSRGELGGFTIFYSPLEEGEELENYIRERRLEGEIDYVTSEVSNTALLAFYWQEEPGPNGGSVFDVYFTAFGDEVLWLRAELLGSDEEQQTTWDEFWEIVFSMEVY